MLKEGLFLQDLFELMLLEIEIRMSFTFRRITVDLKFFVPKPQFSEEIYFFFSLRDCRYSPCFSLRLVALSGSSSNFFDFCLSSFLTNVSRRLSFSNFS